MRNFQFKEAITLHQPHFLPWIPYFARLASASVYVVLDNVQYRRYFYQNRTKIIEFTSNKEQWLIVPVTSSTKLKISQVEIVDYNAIHKICRHIHQNYKNTTYFSEYWPQLEDALLKHYKYLIDLNLSLLNTIFKILEIIQPKFIYCSNMTESTGRTMRIVHVCDEMNRHAILTGFGLSNIVHDNNLLTRRAIQLVPFRNEYLIQKYKSQEGLSILHQLFLHGKDHIIAEIDEINNDYRKTLFRQS